jgi:GH24 family phage-related lysozyme (muramidase)
MPQLSEQSMGTAKSLGDFVKSPNIGGAGDMGSPADLLGQIYELMLKVQEEQDIDHELSMRDEKKKEKRESDRNAALIKALTARKKPKAKRPPKKKEEAKKEEKPPTKPAEKKVEEKKPPEKKEEAVKKQVDKESEKAKQQAQKEADKAKKTAEKEQAAAKKKVEEEAKQKAEPIKPPEVKPPKTEPVTKPPEVKPPSTTKLPAAGKAAAGVAAAVSGTGVKAMIMQHEGKVNYPYKDSLGLWTIGVGHLIQPGNGKTLPPEYDAYKNNGGPYDKKNNKTPAMTDEQILKLFDEDFEHHKKMAMATPGWDLANETGQAAMIDLAFNMGGGWYKKFPNTSKALAAGDFNKASEGLKDSVWYTQVKERGVKIVDMIRNGKKTDNTNTASTPQMIPPPSPSSSKVASLSKENADLNSNLEKQQQSTTVNNVNNTTNQQGSSGSSQPKQDDRSAMQKKMQG